MLPLHLPRHHLCVVLATTTPCLLRRSCLLQVCGGYTEQMAQVAQLLDEQLGDNIDFVDINCGEAITTLGVLTVGTTHSMTVQRRHCSCSQASCSCAAQVLLRADCSKGVSDDSSSPALAAVSFSTKA